MKYLVLFLFLFCSSLAHTQPTQLSDRVRKNDTIRRGLGIIYGNFIQRVGSLLKQSVLPQYILLKDLETDELLACEVIQKYDGRRENIFCLHVPPGTYAMVRYFYAKNGLISDAVFWEPVIRPADDGAEEGTVPAFTFTVRPETLHYVGTWHFETSQVRFTDNKFTFDESIRKKYPKLDLEAATRAIPR